jgi:hypothetical protein
MGCAGSRSSPSIWPTGTRIRAGSKSSEKAKGEKTPIRAKRLTVLALSRWVDARTPTTTRLRRAGKRSRFPSRKTSHRSRLPRPRRRLRSLVRQRRGGSGPPGWDRAVSARGGSDPGRCRADRPRNQRPVGLVCDGASGSRAEACRAMDRRAIGQRLLGDFRMSGPALDGGASRLGPV